MPSVDHGPLNEGPWEKGGQPIKKIGRKLTSSDSNEARTASNPIGRSLGRLEDLSNGKMPTNVGEKMAKSENSSTMRPKIAGFLTSRDSHLMRLCHDYFYYE